MTSNRKNGIHELVSCTARNSESKLSVGNSPWSTLKLIFTYCRLVMTVLRTSGSFSLRTVFAREVNMFSNGVSSVAITEYQFHTKYVLGSQIGPYVQPVLPTESMSQLSIEVEVGGFYTSVTADNSESCPRPS